MIKKLKKMATSYRALPDKKRYAEFITATLSIPVLITVLITNFNNINGSEKSSDTEKKDSNIVISYVPQKETISTTTSTTPEPCKKGIGNVEITSPGESEEITDDHVTAHISSDNDYCAVVWSYRINNGKWSEYDDNSISLYNLENGETKFELRIKSLVNKEEKTLSRKFVYNKDTEAKEATPSAE